MSINDIAAIGSLVSSIAVLVSLIYLAQQVRQSAQQTRAAMGHNRSTRIVEMNMRQAEPDLGRLLVKARFGQEPLTGDEILRYYAFCRAHFTNAEDNFVQHREGLLSDAAYTSGVRIFGQFMNAPSARAVWRFMSPNFDPAFAAMVDGLVESGRPMTGRQFFNLWPELLADEVARTAAAQAAPAPGA